MENDLNDEQKIEITQEMAEEFRAALQRTTPQPDILVHVTINGVYHGLHSKQYLIHLYDEPHLEGTKIEYWPY